MVWGHTVFVIIDSHQRGYQNKNIQNRKFDCKTIYSTYMIQPLNKIWGTGKNVGLVFFSVLLHYDFKIMSACACVKTWCHEYEWVWFAYKVLSTRALK